MNKKLLFIRRLKSISTLLYAFCLILSFVYFASCSEGFEDEAPFTSDVQGVTLNSPDSVAFSLSSNDTTLTISWPVVFGAGGYLVTFYNVDDPANPVVVGTGNDTIDGCSVIRTVAEDSKYKIVVKTLGNLKYKNASAESATAGYFTTFTAAYATIPTGTDLFTYFTENPIPTSSSELVYELEASGTYTMSGNVSLPLSTITFRGDKVYHPTIQMSSGVFLSEGAGTKFKSIDFDCSSFTGSGILALNSTVNSGLTVGGGFAIIPSTVAFQKCKIKSLPKPLVYDNAQKYALQTFLISDCVIQQNLTTGNLISIGGSFVKDLTISNSTIYNSSISTSGFMIAYVNGANVSKVTGAGWASGSVTLTNSTFWQISKASNIANYSGMSQNYNTLTVKKCIFVDSGNKQVIRRLSINTTMKRVLDYNSYWYDGAFVDAEISSSYDNSTTYINTDPNLRDPANGDFTPQGADQIANKTGDPRWYE